uniref:G-protein coupled receptors family 1 profile domain-containing protein n=1 Tax=Erpetoichthys calabaricus TaxID=27687 RepID=A0A8C4X6W3_ERPCA
NSKSVLWSMTPLTKSFYVTLPYLIVVIVYICIFITSFFIPFISFNDCKTSIGPVPTHIHLSVLTLIYFSTLAGNLFTFYMLRFRKCGMSETANIYLSALAIMDCCCLLWVTLLDLSWTFLQGHPFWHMYPWCGLHTFLEFGAITSSIWIVVTFTLERYLVLRDPTARKHFSHARFSRRVLLLVILVSHVVSIPAYWINVVIMCIYNETTFSTVVVWINTFLSGGIPFTLIIVFNSLIARQLTKASKLFTKEQQRTMKGIINRGLVRRTILLLFTVSFTFVFLCLPHFITYCILRTTYNYQDFNRDDYSQPINVAGDLAVMLQNLNYTANFLLYCVVSKQFRRELQVVASCGRKAASRQKLLLTSSGFRT